MKTKAPLRTIAILVVLVCFMLFAVGVSADAPQTEFDFSLSGSALSGDLCTAPFDNSIYMTTRTANAKSQTG